VALGVWEGEGVPEVVVPEGGEGEEVAEGVEEEDITEGVELVGVEVAVEEVAVVDVVVVEAVTVPNSTLAVVALYEGLKGMPASVALRPETRTVEKVPMMLCALMAVTREPDRMGTP